MAAWQTENVLTRDSKDIDFKTQLHQSSYFPGISNSVSLNLSFLICKMGVHIGHSRQMKTTWKGRVRKAWGEVKLMIFFSEASPVSFFFLIIIYFAVLSLRSGMLSLRCSMWDLVPWPGIEPRCPALGAQSLIHWTTREIPSPGS